MITPAAIPPLAPPERPLDELEPLLLGVSVPVELLLDDFGAVVEVPLQWYCPLKTSPESYGASVEQSMALELWT
jgi:hypothetical protein